MGWGGIKNGALLELAEKEFDVFLTGDRNLSFQQSITSVTRLCLIADTKK